MAALADDTLAVDAVATEAAPELAWSLADDDELELPRSWRPAIRIALGVFAACVAIAGGITAVDRQWFSELRTTTVASAAPTYSALPTPDAIAEPVTEAPVSAYPTGAAAEHMVPPIRAIPPNAELPTETYNADVFYLNTLRSYGIRITNPYVAIEAAHTTCAYLRAGHSPNEAVGVAMMNNASLSIDDARGYVIAATAAYCPDVSPR